MKQSHFIVIVLALVFLNHANAYALRCGAGQKLVYKGTLNEQCVACSVGKFKEANSHRHKKCKKCPRKTYAPYKGSVECLPFDYFIPKAPPSADCNKAPVIKALTDISAFDGGEVTTVSTERGDFTGTVFTLSSNFALDSDIEINYDEILVIADGATLTIPAAHTVHAFGLVINKGNLDNQGAITSAYADSIYIPDESPDPSAGVIYNDEFGYVLNNNNGTIMSYGNMKRNGKYGVVLVNGGIIEENYGRIDWNDKQVVKNHGYIMGTDGTTGREGGVLTNLGHIVTLYGDVVSNSGAIYTNYGTIQSNNLLVVNNYGIIELNAASGIIDDNHAEGIINEDLSPPEDDSRDK